MASRHDPVINSTPDGRWEVNCPDCLELMAAGVDVPVGIGLSVGSWEVATRLWANHVGLVDESDNRQVQPVVTSLARVGSGQVELPRRGAHRGLQSSIYRST